MYFSRVWYHSGSFANEKFWTNQNEAAYMNKKWFRGRVTNSDWLVQLTNEKLEAYMNKS
jgi:hypothetical protein